jgi:iron-regulated transporter 1
VSSYILFYVLFQSDTLRQAALNGGKGPNPIDSTHRNANVWILFTAITILGCFLILANVGVSVSIERDWVTSISRGSSRRLTRLNAIMRRIDLLSKLLAPLFVSLLTSVTSYANSCLILLFISAGTTFFEVIFIGIVYRRFKILGEEESNHRERQNSSEQQQISGSDAVYPPRRGFARPENFRTISRLLLTWIRSQYSDWKTFAAMPIFISERFLARRKYYLSKLFFFQALSQSLFCTCRYFLLTALL